MEEEFDLGVLLTFTTGYFCTDNWMSLYDLAWFLYDDNLIHIISIFELFVVIKKHILLSHPQLKDIVFDPNLENSKEKWLAIQKFKYGEKLLMKRITHQVVSLEDYKKNRQKIRN